MLKRSYKKIIKNLDTIKDGVNKALGINDRENKLFIDLIYDLILAFAQNPNKTTTETFSDLLVKKENKLRKEFKKNGITKNFICSSSCIKV